MYCAMTAHCLRPPIELSAISPAEFNCWTSGGFFNLIRVVSQNCGFMSRSDCGMKKPCTYFS